MTQFGMTPMQAKCLQVIRTGIEAEGVAPSYEKIAAALGLASKAGVYRLVTALVERGYLTKLPNRKHSLALVLPKKSPLAGFSLAELQAEIGRRAGHFQTPFPTPIHCQNS